MCDEEKNIENGFKDANEVEDTEEEEMPTKKKRRVQKCPRCKTAMKRAGEIRAGPRGGLRPVYYCPQCGYTTIR